ncbi:hypothetical protein K488DRAFT_82937 [Vararia minispora EC-137]|uniref:Uncharacterized protein n=1 Tax=Vararia minispora EC-137 TaxID=1314806 RepID=A0ACB8QV44_9AGAM|nr:hypothetical protein K488DRAFT_82937 [Vararia minispora EC-137]
MYETSWDSPELDFTIEDLTSAIHRVPPELWREIFFKVFVECKPSRRHRSIGWVKVAHVCRKWRYIALEFPKIWARSICSLPGGTNAFMERARNALLVLDSTPTCEQCLTSQQLELAVTNLHRIEALSHDDAFDWWHSLGKRPYPHLKALRVSPIQEAIPMTHLRGFPLSFTPSVPVFPALRSLTLVSGGNSVAQTLCILQHTPVLESLFLYRAISKHDNGDVSDFTGKVVALTKLSTFEMRDSAARIGLILRHTSFPVSTDIYLIPDFWPFQDDPELRKCLSSRIQQPAYDVLNVVPYDPITDSDTLPQCSGFERHYPRDLRSFTWKISFSVYGDTLRSVGTLTFLAHEEPVRRIVRTLRDALVTTLELGDIPKPDLSELAHTMRRHAAAAYGHRWIVENGILKVLDEVGFSRMQVVVLDMSLVMDARPPSAHVVRSRWRDLNNVLERRAQLGYPVTRLRLVGQRYALGEDALAEEDLGSRRARRVVPDVIDDRTPY